MLRLRLTPHEGGDVRSESPVFKKSCGKLVPNQKLYLPQVFIKNELNFPQILLSFVDNVDLSGKVVEKVVEKRG